MGIRLHLLAKELGIQSKDLVTRCHSRGIKVKSHLSSVPEAIAQVLRKEILGRRQREEAEALAKAQAPPKTQEAPPRQPPRQRPPFRRDQQPVRRDDGQRPQQRPATGPPQQRPRPFVKEAPRPPAAPPPATEQSGIKPRKKLDHKDDKPAPVDETKDKRPRKGRERDRERRVVTAAPVEDRVWHPPKKDARGGERPRFRGRPRGGPAQTVKAERPSQVEVIYPLSLRELSSATGIKAEEMIRHLVLKGVMISINDTVPESMIPDIASAFSMQIDIKKEKSLEEETLEMLTAPDRAEDLQPRAPVVTFLGHVDHGKTSLLDRIRSTNVTAKEFGGITQHIGAYSVDFSGRRVVFLDTPGHEAFTAMRARGANVTDVVVLVVAADDGVMPQTIEAINHAKAAGVPILIALNKIDKPEANPSRVRQQLVEHDLTPHDWGGNTELVEVSAITGQGVDDLLETLSLESELLELKANPNKLAVGTVLEAHLSESRGVAATVLIREGTLKPGDYVLCGSAYGRIRSIYDDKGRNIAEAGPATPVEIAGLETVPEAGDTLQAVTDLQRARDLAESRTQRVRQETLRRRKHVTLETLFTHLAEAQVKEANVIIKADVKGSAEVLTKAFNDIATSEVRVNILHAAVGGVTESDVLLADASDAVIIAFQVVPEDRANDLAEEKGVEIRRYRVIYQAVDDIKKALEGLLEPEKREEIVGHLNVTNIFRSSKFGIILGGQVSDGRIIRNDFVRLIRDRRVIYDGKIMSMRREKEDVREVKSGFECGVRLTNFNDAREGDILEAYVIHEIARKLA